MLQAPPEQAGVPWLLEHTVPQTPQLLVSAASDFSQPSPVLPLQFPYRYEQAPIAQAPAEQVGVAWAYEQTVVQVPQWFRSVLVFCSQPLAALLSQLA